MTRFVTGFDRSGAKQADIDAKEREATGKLQELILSPRHQVKEITIGDKRDVH